MKTPTTLLALGLLAGGSALAQPAQYLDLRTPNTALTVRVTEDSLSSPDLQLGISDDYLRGRAYGRPVNIQLKDDKITGIYGGGPVDLKVQEENDTLRAEGLFGGQISNFEVSPEAIRGTVGRCSYELTANKDISRYQGWRSCGGGGLENPVSLSIPPSLADDDEELVASLSVLLSR